MTRALMPRLRMPLWVAVGIPAATYTIRSIVRRSFRPDLPEDAFVLAVLLVVLLAAALYGSAAQRRRDELGAEVNGEDGGEGDSGQRDEV